MGDRFYMQQLGKTGSPKPKRRLKADICKSINQLLDTEIPSLSSMTVDGLEKLEKAIQFAIREEEEIF